MKDRTLVYGSPGLEIGVPVHFNADRPAIVDEPETPAHDPSRIHLFMKLGGEVAPGLIEARWVLAASKGRDCGDQEAEQCGAKYPRPHDAQTEFITVPPERRPRTRARANVSAAR